MTDKPELPPVSDVAVDAAGVVYFTLRTSLPTAADMVKVLTAAQRPMYADALRWAASQLGNYVNVDPVLFLRDLADAIERTLMDDVMNIDAELVARHNDLRQRLCEWLELNNVNTSDVAIRPITVTSKSIEYDAYVRNDAGNMIIDRGDEVRIERRTASITVPMPADLKSDIVHLADEAAAEHPLIDITGPEDMPNMHGMCNCGKGWRCIGTKAEVEAAHNQHRRLAG